MFFFSILPFLSFCSSQEKRSSSQKLNWEKILSEGNFYQKVDGRDSENSFEKSSNITRFLSLRKIGSSYQAREVEISIFSYTENFLQKIQRVFGKNTLKKYFIEQKMKIGKMVPDESEREFQIDYSNFFQRKIEEDDLLKGIDLITELDFENLSSKSKQKVFFQFKSDGKLWKSQEQILYKKNTWLKWKNFNSGPGIMKSMAYAEFIKEGESPLYSKINKKSRYQYRPILNSQKDPIVLFENDDYQVSFPSDTMENSKISDLNQSKNSQFELFDNMLPIFVHRKTGKK